MEINELRERLATLATAIDPFERMITEGISLWEEKCKWRNVLDENQERLDALPAEWATALLQGRAQPLELSDLRLAIENAEAHLKALEIADKILNQQHEILDTYRAALAEAGRLCNDFDEQIQDLESARETQRRNEQQAEEAEAEIAALYDALKKDRHNQRAKDQISYLEESIPGLRRDGNIRMLFEHLPLQIQKTAGKIDARISRCDRILEQARADGWLPAIEEPAEGQEPETEKPAEEPEAKGFFRRIF